MLTDLLTDQAEYELLQRKRHTAEWCELPAAQESPPAPPQGAAELPELERLVGQLHAEVRPTVPLVEVVPWGSFEESAYRLSMLSLLGDAEAADSGGPVAKLASLPYSLAVQTEAIPVGRAGVARMSVGHLRHQGGVGPLADEAGSAHGGGLGERSGSGSAQEPSDVP